MKNLKFWINCVHIFDLPSRKMLRILVVKFVCRFFALKSQIYHGNRGRSEIKYLYVIVLKKCRQFWRWTKTLKFTFSTNFLPLLNIKNDDSPFFVKNDHSNAADSWNILQNYVFDEIIMKFGMLVEHASAMIFSYIRLSQIRPVTAMGTIVTNIVTI